MVPLPAVRCGPGARALPRRYPPGSTGRPLSIVRGVANQINAEATFTCEELDVRVNLPYSGLLEAVCIGALDTASVLCSTTF